MITALPAEVSKHISDELGLKIIDFNFTGGGCINNGGKLQSSDGTFFLKWNDAARYPGMFAAEAKGLNILRGPGVIRLPQVKGAYTGNTYQFILLEFIGHAAKTRYYWKNFGESLAQLHRVTADTFGLDHHNYIGSLRQYNEPKANWVDFFIEHRLEAQLKIASTKHLADATLRARFENIYKRLPHLLPVEKPALLHGDLWSGNLITDENGEPCLIDPAVYFGHREAELAFTQLFGGFDREFYWSYEETFPLQPGFSQRADVYNLYPLLVHANLFGESYIHQVRSVLQRFV